MLIPISETAEMSLEAGCLKLNGDLRLANLSHLSAQQLEAFNGKVSMVDCAKVVSADSSTIAFLAYLQTHNEASFSIQAFPEYLLPLVKLYDLQTILHCLDS